MFDTIMFLFIQYWNLNSRVIDHTFKYVHVFVEFHSSRFYLSPIYELLIKLIRVTLLLIKL